jgi:light-regulated signal transduction histidine kinase (bacteriophytochrome)
LGVLPAAGPFLVLALSSSTEVPGQGAANLLLAISIAIFVVRVGAFERQLQTYREHLEDLVAARTAELEGTNKQMESFSYSVAHDLRAPLRAVDGFSALLASSCQDALDDEGRRLLGVIRENVKRMATLIDDLLQFSRSGRAELRKTRLDVNEMVESVFAQLVGPEDLGRVDFRVADLPAANGDAALVRQVWTNLLSNALKFSSLRVRAVIEVGCRMEDGRVVYFVKDNGAGFDTRYSTKLFGVFQRLHSPSEFPGVGIGLAIVQRIVARHGGTVRAEGVVGEGATFSFSL